MLNGQIRRHKMGLPVCPIRTRGAQRQLPGPQEEQVLLKEIAAVAGRINKHKTNVQSFKEHVEKQSKEKQEKKNKKLIPKRKIVIITRKGPRVKQVPKKNEYCLFFSKYGECKEGEKCQYIHDREKVAVCRKFLKGKCNDPHCKLSHKTDKDKMPVCHYFLQGICNNEHCPYSHVKVNVKAEVCPDFGKGYCPRGSTCKLKHTLKCQAYALTGKCPDGKNCKLQHTTKKRKRKEQLSEDTADLPVKKIKPNF